MLDRDYRKVMLYLKKCLVTKQFLKVKVRASKKYNPKLAKELRKAIKDVLEGRTVELKELLKKIKEDK